MGKGIVWIFLTLFTLELAAQEGANIIKEYRMKGRNKFVGKEVVTVRTFCVDGYKFLISGSSFIQFYEDQDGLPMPAKCDVN
jgi:hypothetical protein